MSNMFESTFNQDQVEGMMFSILKLNDIEMKEEENWKKYGEVLIPALRRMIPKDSEFDHWVYSFGLDIKPLKSFHIYPSMFVLNLDKDSYDVTIVEFMKGCVDVDKSIRVELRAETFEEYLKSLGVAPKKGGHEEQKIYNYKFSTSVANVLQMVEDFNMPFLLDSLKEGLVKEREAYFKKNNRNWSVVLYKVDAYINDAPRGFIFSLSEIQLYLNKKYGVEFNNPLDGSVTEKLKQYLYDCNELKYINDRKWEVL